MLGAARWSSCSTRSTSNRYSPSPVVTPSYRASPTRASPTPSRYSCASTPTGNLDPANKDRVLDILVDYAEEHGATLVTVTHDHDLLDRFGRVIDFKGFFSGGAVRREAET